MSSSQHFILQDVAIPFPLKYLDIFHINGHAQTPCFSNMPLFQHQQCEFIDLQPHYRPDRLPDSNTPAVKTPTKTDSCSTTVLSRSFVRINTEI